MAKDKLRRQIAWEAARMMYLHQEKEYFRAKLKAARRLSRGWVNPQDLPSNREVREEIQSLARSYEAKRREEHLREMRLEALRVMGLVRTFNPRLIGGTLTGDIRAESHIEIHAVSDNVDEVARALDDEGVAYEKQREPVDKHDDDGSIAQIRIQDHHQIVLTVYPSDQALDGFSNSATNEPIPRASIAELETLLAESCPDEAMDQTVPMAECNIDRFRLFEMLLLPLEAVRQSPKYHPEGDALYHSLQVFTLAREALPYDEEFLLAALLHDVGKAIDSQDHVAASLEVLHGHISPRTAWLIENHAAATDLRGGKLGVRSRRRLEAAEDFDELVLLADCDRRGRERGVQVPEVAEALLYIRELDDMFS